MNVLNQKLERLLQKQTQVRVIPFDLNREKPVVFDFSRDNHELKSIDIADTQAFSRYIFNKLDQKKARAGIGKYDENRTIYERSAVFDSSSEHPGQRRSLHIGLDLWIRAGTPVLAALEGRVHSFQDNNAFGDYGPTIILEHLLEGISFYTLYGHLNRGCLVHLKKGQRIQAGQEIARLGEMDENGQWPPHLHLGIISDLQGKQGDFPGVCALKDREKYLQLCPDPNLLLKIRAIS
ncbi:MAG: peptidoglycan DD-metalloendopeptidase family protein [Desulfonatronovibrio sp.]